MASIKMPIESATITVSDGESSESVQIYDAVGLIPDTEHALVIPPSGSFRLDVVATRTYAYETQTLGGGCPEWVILMDSTEGGTMPYLSVEGTAPQGFDGPVNITINGVYEDVTYTFPGPDTALSLTVMESDEGEPTVPAEDIEWTYPDGADVGGGFLNLRRFIVHADSLMYRTGGVSLPTDLDVEAVIEVSAKGGLLGCYDREAEKLVLYTASGVEAQGTLEDVTVVVLGRRRRTVFESGA